MFSELPPQTASTTKQQYLDAIRPWLDVIWRLFGPERTMFGGDWPICTMNGLGAQAWITWHDVVDLALTIYGFTDAQKTRLWAGTAVEAYKL